jgi:hypothetical protein
LNGIERSLCRAKAQRSVHYGPFATREQVAWRRLSGVQARMVGELALAIP